jgi:co-chaperonin GroES (HSP10)
MRITPLGTRVLIKRNKVDDVSGGGILLPGNTDKKEKRGVIVEIGEQVAELVIGDLVLFADYTGTLISDGDEHYAVIKEEEIVATYTD